MTAPRRRWEPWEIEYLTLNAGRFTAEYVGLRLGRTTRAVTTFAHERGIKFVQNREWTKAELFYLRVNAGPLTAKQIAEDLSRSVSEITSQAQRQGVRFGIRRKYTDEEIAQVLALHAEGISYADIEARTGVKASTFKEYIGGRRRRTITARKG